MYAVVVVNGADEPSIVSLPFGSMVIVFAPPFVVRALMLRRSLLELAAAGRLMVTLAAEALTRMVLSVLVAVVLVATVRIASSDKFWSPVLMPLLVPVMSLNRANVPDVSGRSHVGLVAGHDGGATKYPVLVAEPSSYQVNSKP